VSSSQAVRVPHPPPTARCRGCRLSPPRQVRGLVPRSGWQQGLSHALTGSGLAMGALEPGAHVQELPVPVVQVFCGPTGFEVSAQGPTLNPMFPRNG
jgi:hypothetical protein